MPDVAVWLVWIEDMALALSGRGRADPPLLTASDLTYVRSQPDAARRRAAEATRTALRLALRHHLGVYAANQPITRGPMGKPLLPSGIGGFSISHTERMALIAVTDRGSIGVDLEASRELSFSSERQAKIRSAAEIMAETPLVPDAHGLLQGWTRLEAVAKARGSGIGQLLGDVRIWGTGHGACTEADVRAAAAAVVSTESISVHDLDLPPELYGTVALQPACSGAVIRVERVAASWLLSRRGCNS